MSGEKKKEPVPPAKDKEPDLATVLAALARSEEASKAALAASEVAQKELSKKFKSLLADSRAKHALLQKEIATLQNKSTDDELDCIVYCDHVPEVNPFPRRPRNCSLKPDHYNLYGDQTADLLDAKTHSSLKYEYRTLAAVLSYLFDVKALFEETRENESWSTLEDDQATHLEAIYNTFEGCYSMLSKRHAVIKIRARAEAETGGVSDENQLLLNYFETKLHGVFPGEALVDSEIEGWLTEFRERTAAAELKQAAAKSASRKTGQKNPRSGEDKPPAKSHSQFKKDAERRKASAHPKKQ